jgi:predicted RecB family nuclease
MSGQVGNIGDENVPTPEQVKAVMTMFDVDEKFAKAIMNYAKQYATERMAKWVYNYRKLQKNKADEIYRLLRVLKQGHKNVIDEIEKRILELCIQ